jgi:hypothetical protein
MQVKAANTGLQNQSLLVVKSAVKTGPMIIVRRDD